MAKWRGRGIAENDEALPIAHQRVICRKTDLEEVGLLFLASRCLSNQELCHKQTPNYLLESLTANTGDNTRGQQ